MGFVCFKSRPNDRNMPTQHIATLLGVSCCVRLATVLRHVATCWVLLAQIWPFSNLSQQHLTCRNTSQHGKDICIFTFSLFSDSGLLNGFDFYFGLIWMAWHCKPDTQVPFLELALIISFFITPICYFAVFQRLWKFHFQWSSSLKAGINMNLSEILGSLKRD